MSQAQQITLTIHLRQEIRAVLFRQLFTLGLDNHANALHDDIALVTHDFDSGVELAGIYSRAVRAMKKHHYATSTDFLMPESFIRWWYPQVELMLVKPKRPIDIEEPVSVKIQLVHALVGIKWLTGHRQERSLWAVNDYVCDVLIGSHLQQPLVISILRKYGFIDKPRRKARWPDVRITYLGEAFLKTMTNDIKVPWHKQIHLVTK